MMTNEIKEFANRIGHAFVATADANGNPHLAAGRDVSIVEPAGLVFESWFCQTTLKNLQGNPNLAVVIADPATGNGFQFIGRVERIVDTAVLDGYVPDLEPAGMPQVQWRLEIRVESVMTFTADAHSDRPLG